MNTLTLDNKEYIVVARDTWQGLMDIVEDRLDSVFATSIIEKVDNEESFPHDFVVKLCSGEEPPLKLWREYRGFSGRQLAKKVGISSSYLSDIENGKKDGSVSVVKRIAEVLQVDIDDII
ncbi:MAG: helix-turn-helix transcriptional regulator [Pasteurella sp.]|nr:helix-turn-helix transcriptional regulator [Pasteurella sp.]